MVSHLAGAHEDQPEQLTADVFLAITRAFDKASQTAYQRGLSTCSKSPCHCVSLPVFLSYSVHCACHHPLEAPLARPLYSNCELRGHNRRARVVFRGDTPWPVTLHPSTVPRTRNKHRSPSNDTTTPDHPSSSLSEPYPRTFDSSDP